MDTLAAIGADMPDILGFDDGMVNINELVRMLVQALVNEIMDAQVEEACADGNQRNGHRECALLTSVGRITLRIPKPGGACFPENLIERYGRVDRAVIATVSEMVINGVSTLPFRKSLIRLLGAVLSEMDEGWASRCWFTEESTSGVFEDRSRWKPGRWPSYEGTAAEHAACIIAVVVADGGAGKKTA